MNRTTPRIAALAPALLAGAVLGCEVADPAPTGGGLQDDGDVCGPGLVVVSTDYQSSSVAFVRWDGEVVAHRVISSGSTEPALTAALSGDVVAPTMESGAIETVLVDRYPASVLTWVRVEDGAPTRQLSLATGFSSNLQDWIAVSETKGYASRYQANPDPGREPFDGGSDVLVVDPRTPEIVGRIAFDGVLDGADADLVPSPGRMLIASDRLVVLLSVYSTDFTRSGEGRVAVIDVATDRVTAVHLVPGLRGCSALALAPDGESVAVGCSGTFGGDARPSLDDAGVAVLALADGAVTTRVVAADALGAPPGFSISFASNGGLLVPTVGHLADDRDPLQQDAIHLIPIGGASSTRLLEGVEPFTLGEVRCSTGCGACVVADSGRGVLHRFTVAEGGLTAAADVVVEDGLGHLPVYLGALPRAADGAPADGP